MCEDEYQEDDLDNLEPTDEELELEREKEEKDQLLEWFWASEEDGWAYSDSDSD